jgi:exonuclease SbcC
VGLEDWVLRTYLDEVVVAANAHLAEMSNGRYELEVDPDRARGPGRAGLELAVLDAWTGQSRPTASLSGGETFLASLALALGLADVATGANAGLRLDALFVDEGFGSLDEDTLDLAIDVLDRLRRRGAMVGVITHVEAMKDALPVAIEVTPRGDRGGSTVKVTQVA